MPIVHVSVTRLFTQLRRATLTGGAWGIVLFVEEVLLLIFLALWQHGVFVPVAETPASDFVSFYAAGKLALAGVPQLAYDQAAHYLAQQQVTRRARRISTSSIRRSTSYCARHWPRCRTWWRSPCSRWRHSAFSSDDAVAAARTGRRLAGPAAGVPGGVLDLRAGAERLSHGRPVRRLHPDAGEAPGRRRHPAGHLCYKPHFGLLVPGALLAGRRWAAFFAAATTVAWLVGVSIALFGWQTWQAYFVAFAHSDQVYSTGVIDYAGIVTPFGAARLLGFAPWPAYFVQGIAALVMAVLIALLWRRDVSQNLRAAALLSATLLAVPLALLYDKLLVLVAIGWLVREARQHGFLPWEKLTLLAIYPVSLLTWTHRPGVPSATRTDDRLRRAGTVAAPYLAAAADEAAPQPTLVPRVSSWQVPYRSG